MTSWIQVDVSFRNHRKTKRLIRAIGEAGRWIPVWLWLYCVDSARDGDLSKLTPQDLADVLDYEGDAEGLRAALIDSGFITGDGVVVGWKERYSDKFEFYQRRAKAAAEKRWGKQAPSSAPPTQTEAELRGEGEEISKHAQASLKDASSIASPSVLFPWATLDELPDQLRAALANAFPSTDRQSQAFTIIRGRKLGFHDQHTLAEWSAVFTAEVSRERDSTPRERRASFA